MTATNTLGNSFFARLYDSAGGPDACKSIYDDWAATYNRDLSEHDYRAPTVIAEAVLASNGNINGSICDAGCGTGLSGIALAQLGAKTIDGLDISPGMLGVAEKTGCYRNLAVADLSKPIDKEDASYDVVTCVGTLTHGHVGPVPALKEFVRITRKGGIVAGTVRDDIWVSDGYEAEVERLKGEGLVEVVSTKNDDYRKAAGVTAKTLVLRKI